MERNWIKAAAILWGAALVTFVIGASDLAFICLIGAMWSTAVVVGPDL